MIGRAAQGRPWIFREIAHHLETGGTLASPSPREVGAILLGHLEDLYAFHGELQGVRLDADVVGPRQLQGGGEGARIERLPAVRRHRHVQPGVEGGRAVGIGAAADLAVAVPVADDEAAPVDVEHHGEACETRSDGGSSDDN